MRVEPRPELHTRPWRWITAETDARVGTDVTLSCGHAVNMPGKLRTWGNRTKCPACPTYEQLEATLSESA